MGKALPPDDVRDVVVGDTQAIGDLGLALDTAPERRANFGSDGVGDLRLRVQLTDVTPPSSERNRPCGEVPTCVQAAACGDTPARPPRLRAL